MPPSSAAGDYSRHVGYLQRLCSGEPISGFIEETAPYDDPGFLSPPTVLPMYLCATQIGVSRARLGAEVELRLDGVSVSVPVAVRNPDLTVFDLAALDGIEDLGPDQRWTARQRIGGGPWSEESFEVFPADVTDAYPSGIPAPAIVPTPVYDCAQAIAVTHIPGATLHVERSIGADFEWLGAPSGYSVVRAATPFGVTEQLSVAQSFCNGDPSMTSETVTVDPEPYPIGPPVLPNVYEQQQLFLVTALTHGTTQTLSSSVAGPFASLNSWPTSVRPIDAASLLARPLLLGETLQVTHGLCDSFATGTSVPALSCEDIPPAEIAPLFEGDVEVIVVGEGVPGSTIRVLAYLTGEEIGDSSGNVINLSREVIAGETLQVQRELNADCRATTSFVIEVL